MKWAIKDLDVQFGFMKWAIKDLSIQFGFMKWAIKDLDIQCILIIDAIVMGNLLYWLH